MVTPSRQVMVFMVLKQSPRSLLDRVGGGGPVNGFATAALIS